MIDSSGASVPDRALVNDAPPGHHPTGFDPSRDHMTPKFNRWQGVRHIDATGEFAAFCAGYAGGMADRLFGVDDTHADVALAVEPPSDAAMSRDARWGFEYARQRIADTLRYGGPRDSDGSPQGGDGEAGSVHDSAGPQDIAKEQP